MTRTECQDKAVEEFEQILKDANWLDTYYMTATDIEEATQPLFTRKHIDKNLIAKPIILKYTLTDDITSYADNKKFTGLIYINASIYLKDPFAFDGNKSTQQGYLTNIEKYCEERDWQMSFDGEQIVPALELVEQSAQYQKNYTFIKRFNN